MMNSDIIQKIDSLFIDLNNELNIELKKYSEMNKIWDVETLQPNFHKTKMTKNELLNFQLKHKIKIAHGNKMISWNPEYKREALNARYLIVIDNLKGFSLDFKFSIIEKFDENSLDSVIKFLSKKIKKLHKLKSSAEGKIYYHEKYRNSSFHLGTDRFDVIWKINEQYHLWPLMKRKGHPANYGEWSDYPFVNLDLQQWIDFEKSYRLIPILKQILSLFTDNGSDIKKYTSKFKIQNVINKTNRFPEVFIDAKSCELFFYVAQILTIKKKVDWTYIYLIAEHRDWLKKNIKEGSYIWLINKIFSAGLKQLRSDYANTVFTSKNNSIEKNIKAFDKLIEASNYKA